MPQDNEIYQLMPTRKIAAIILSCLGVLMTIASAYIYILPEAPYWLPLLLCALGFVCILLGALFSLLERLRHTRARRRVQSLPDE